MNTQRITHHISPEIMTAYLSGNLSKPFALVVATHISMCDDCRAAMEAHAAVGGALLNDMDLEEICAPNADMKARLMDCLDDDFEILSEPVARGIFPAPLNDVLEGKDPKWKSLGPSVKQSILEESDEGSVRLLKIAAGSEMPEHGHGGLELTLVLQGAFQDEDGHFQRGDLEIADGDTDHRPVAVEGEDCICLVAMDASLQFKSVMPRIFQSIFRI